MTRRSEQGNVVVFVIVGVLLTAALVGAVFAVRHFQKSGSDTTSTPVTTTTDKKPQGEQPKDSSAQNGTPSSSDQALKDALAAQSKAEKDKQTAQQSATAPANNGAQSTTSTTTANHLPQTGPESTLLGVLGVSLLAGTGFAYLRSRRLI